MRDQSRDGARLMDKEAGDAVQLQFQVSRTLRVLSSFEQVEDTVVLIGQGVQSRQFLGAGDKGALKLTAFDGNDPLDVAIDAHDWCLSRQRASSPTRGAGLFSGNDRSVRQPHISSSWIRRSTMVPW